MNPEPATPWSVGSTAVKRFGLLIKSHDEERTL